MQLSAHPVSFFVFAVPVRTQVSEASLGKLLLTVGNNGERLKITCNLYKEIPANILLVYVYTYIYLFNKLAIYKLSTKFVSNNRPHVFDNFIIRTSLHLNF